MIDTLRAIPDLDKIEYRHRFKTDPETGYRWVLLEEARNTHDELEKRIAELEQRCIRAAYALEVASDWMPEIQIDDGTWKGTFTVATETKEGIEEADND